MTTATTIMARMRNFTCVNIDRDAALNGWNTVANGIANHPEMVEANRKVLIEQKALHGIMGFSAGNFRRFTIRERSAVSRAARRAA